MTIPTSSFSQASRFDEINAAALRISPNPAGLGARYGVLSSGAVSGYSGRTDAIGDRTAPRANAERTSREARRRNTPKLLLHRPRTDSAISTRDPQPTASSPPSQSSDATRRLKVSTSTLETWISTSCSAPRFARVRSSGWSAATHRGGSSCEAHTLRVGSQESALGPELTSESTARYLDTDPFVVVVNDRTPVWATQERRRQLASVRVGLRLPLLEEERAGLVRVLSPSTDGLSEGYVDAESVHVGYLPMTRRHVITHAFRQLDDSFGWAGAGGDRDCSRFLMDLFSLFGLHLPRNSFYQSRTGSYTIDTAEMSDTERRRTFDHALSQGIPLLFMPGHIMLLLGRDGDDYIAIHQFSGYRVGCRPGEDTKMSVDRVSVTTLRLGEGSERRSFMERITRVSVYGSNQGTSL